MRTKLVTVDDSSVIVSMQTLKQHLRVDDNFDDELIGMYAGAAIDIAQAETNRALYPSTYQGSFEFKPVVYLPYGNVTAVNSLTALNSDDVRVAVDYTFNEIDESITMDKDVYGGYDSISEFTEFRVEFVCGYAEGTVPATIQQGILILTATMYNVREQISYGVQGYEVPFTARALFNKHKIYSVSGGV